MPDGSCHQGHSDRTKDVRELLTQQIDRWPEWVVVTAFYEAVHLVERLLACNRIHSSCHEVRNSYLMRNYPIIWAKFGPLYKESRVARYFEGDRRPYSDHMHPNNVRTTVVGNWLHRVRIEVDAEIAKLQTSAAAPAKP